MAESLTDTQKRIIKQKMAGLSGKDAKAQARILANDFSVDITRIYAHSRDVRPKRKRRTDHGTMRAIDPKAFEKLAWYTVNDDYSADHIADVARANGLGDVATSTYNRHLRKDGINRNANKQDIRLYQSWRAPFQNHTHQLDGTVSQQFYIADDFSVQYDDKLKEYYAKKKGMPKGRSVLHLLSLIDDHSRAIYAEFTASNHSRSWMNFLYNAWRLKDDPFVFPFHGIPKFIYTDQDPIVTSHKFQRAMDVLLGSRKNVLTHFPGNPRAKGKVERAFQVMQEFEKVTKRKKWQSLQEANADLTDYLYKVNNRRHSAIAEAPFECWIRIPQERLLAPPNEEIFRILHMDSIWRQIRKNLTISINGKLWQLPWSKPFTNYGGMKEKREIYLFPDDDSRIIVILDDKEYEVHYAEQTLRSSGRHAELPKPARLVRREQLQGSSDPGLKTTQIYKEQYARKYMGKHARKFDENRVTGGKPQDGPMRSFIWFKIECQKHYYFESPPTREQEAFVEQIFAGKLELPEAELRPWLEKLSKGEVDFGKAAAAGGQK